MSSDQERIIAQDLLKANPHLDRFTARLLAETFVRDPDTIERLARGEAEKMLEDLPDNLKVPDRSKAKMRIIISSISKP